MLRAIVFAVMIGLALHLLGWPRPRVARAVLGALAAGLLGEWAWRCFAQGRYVLAALLFLLALLLMPYLVFPRPPPR